MKRYLAIAIIICTVLTFLGCFYVLYTKGSVSAGYACVPMLITVTLLTFYRKQ